MIYVRRKRLFWSSGIHSVLTFRLHCHETFFLTLLALFYIFSAQCNLTNSLFSFIVILQWCNVTRSHFTSLMLVQITIYVENGMNVSLIWLDIASQKKVLFPKFLAFSNLDWNQLFKFHFSHKRLLLCPEHKLFLITSMSHPLKTFLSEDVFEIYTYPIQTFFL